MSNISTVIGAVVGVFIALLVGLSLFGEVADQTAELGAGGGEAVTESYQVGQYAARFVDGSTCTTGSASNPSTFFITVTAINTATGGVERIGGFGSGGSGQTYTCAGTGTGRHNVNLIIYPYAATSVVNNAATTIGEGAVISIETRNNVVHNPGFVRIEQAGSSRTVSSGGGGTNLSSFIALQVILQILPTVVLVGLLAAGGVIGSFIGRSAGGRFA